MVLETANQNYPEKVPFRKIVYVSFLLSCYPVNRKRMRPQCREFVAVVTTYGFLFVRT